MNGDAITDLVPIAHVHNERRELIDDDWGQVASVIRLDAERFTTDALLSLDSFSHLEVVFHFHRVPLDKVQEGARHPRNNPQWPLAYIFAQRGKNRPNRIGVSRCRLRSRRTASICMSSGSTPSTALPCSTSSRICGSSDRARRSSSRSGWTS